MSSQITDARPSTLHPVAFTTPVWGELSLENSLAPGLRRRNPSHIFVKKDKNASITLRGQEPGLKVPWYGRDEMIVGFISCGEQERVVSVKLQVEGKLSIHLSGAAPKVTKLVDSSTTLWEKGDLCSSSCPDEVEFAFMLPHTYESGGQDYPLPPTFHDMDGEGGDLMNVRSSYRMKISVTKAAKHRLSWRKVEYTFLTFDYLPRSVSAEPTSVIPGCLANIKALPNEWYQASRSISFDSHLGLEPITTNLFIPTARVYPIARPIPFHIQVSGRVQELRLALLDSNEQSSAPFSACPDNRATQMDSKMKKRKIELLSEKPTLFSSNFSESERQGYLHPKRVRAFILRQIRVELSGKKHVENRILAEGSLESVPPIMSDCYCHPEACDIEYLSWMGEVKCTEDVKTGGFDGENVVVSDYVVLAIGKREKEPWKSMVSSISIKLVTDSWDMI